MKTRLLLTCALSVALGTCVLAQESPAPPDGQQPNGQQGGRGYGRGMGGGFGRGVMGTVTEVAADHYTVKNDQGETWTVHYSANTRMMKQLPRPANAPPPSQGQGQGQGEGQGQGQGQGQGDGNGMYMRRGSPPQPIQASDIKVGDAIVAMGEMDDAAKSVGAVMVMELDPETAKRMEEMRANFGKTWLSGRVTAIKDTTVTLQGGPDNASYTFVADENTDFRKRREPIALADIQVNDAVRVEGSIKNGQFVATSVNVMVLRPNGGPARRPGPLPQ
jgi:preprotein translocase subunit YajC